MEIELFWFLYEHENGILKIDRDLSPWGVRMLRIMSGENKGQLLLQVCSKLPDDCPLGNGWYVEAIGHASKVKNIEQTDLIILHKIGNPAVLYFKEFPVVGWKVDLSNTFDASNEQVKEMAQARKYFKPDLYTFEQQHKGRAAEPLSKADKTKLEFIYRFYKKNKDNFQNEELLLKDFEEKHYFINVWDLRKAKKYCKGRKTGRELFPSD